MARITITAKVARTTAAADAGVAVDNTTQGWTNTPRWKLRVIIGAGTTTTDARLQFEDTVDNFTTPLAGPVVLVGVPAGLGAPRHYTFSYRDFPNMKIGAGSSKIRTNLKTIANGSITYEAYLEPEGQ